MKRYRILFNPLSKSGKGEEKSKKLNEMLKGDELTYSDITKINDCQSFINELGEDVDLILTGGDGTLNRFVNSVDVENIRQGLYFYAAGSGNDFVRDIDKTGKDELIDVKKYLTHLPTVKVKGRKYKFINNVSFGLDGYCCEEADKQREKSKKKVNYSLIALKGLLGGYSTGKATVEVDGRIKEYDKVWMVPSMNGRFLGGGIMAAPEQDRLNVKHTVTVVVLYNASRLKCLKSFPLMFSGKHTKLDICEIIEGNDIKVTFDSPAAVQIDGETITNVLTYTVSSH